MSPSGDIGEIDIPAIGPVPHLASRGERDLLPEPPVEVSFLSGT